MLTLGQVFEAGRAPGVGCPESPPDPHGDNAREAPPGGRGKASREDTFVSPSYVIGYPPGVPLIVPGDVVTQETIDEVARIQLTGVDIFVIDD